MVSVIAVSGMHYPRRTPPYGKDTLGGIDPVLEQYGSSNEYNDEVGWQETDTIGRRDMGQGEGNKTEKKKEGKERERAIHPFQPVAAFAYSCSMKVFAALVVWLAV